MNILVTGGYGNLGPHVIKAFQDDGNAMFIVPKGSDLVGLYGNNILAGLVHGNAMDALVHLAGRYKGGQPLGETPLLTFSVMMDSNYMTAVRAIQTVIPGMLLQGRGAGCGSLGAGRPRRPSVERCVRRIESGFGPTGQYHP